MIYADTIKKTKLFRQFDKLADFENVSETNIDLLKALVLEVASVVEPCMKRITLTFGQYTEHDLKHLLNIADHIHDFLPTQKLDGETIAIRLNAVELAYLWLAILLHDVGMFVSEADEKQKILDSEAYKAHQRHHRDRLEMANEAQELGHTVKADAIRDAVFAEFIRGQHAVRVRAFIEEHLKDKLRFREMDLSKGIGDLCESHNWGVRQSRDSQAPEHCVLQMNADDLVGKTRVNHRYLACCLRLGDILDFDRTRTPLSAFHAIHFTEPLSVVEWKKHLSIKGISFSQLRIEYAAECETPEDYVTVYNFLDWVDQELREATRIVREFPQELAARYQLNLAPVVERHQVKMADPRFVAGGFRFQLEYDQIMKLLMDKSLYPDETMFLRELLQNALDACRYQQARAEEKGMADKYIPRIQVWDGSGLPRDAADPEKGPRIEFRDNGIGMSLDQVENFFLRVGKSYYRSAHFTAERERLAEKGIHLDACSRFGIGFLSCFLGGDRIVVETFQYGSQPLRITIEGPSKYFVIEQLPTVDLVEHPPFSSPSDPAVDAPPHYAGTKITVYLRENWRQNPSQNEEDTVWKTLDRYAVNQEFPILVSGPEKDTREIGARRWERLAPEMDSEKSVWRNWQKFLAPSVFDLSEHHEHLRGRGEIWFLADRQGNPALQVGELRVGSKGIKLSPFIEAVAAVIQSKQKAQLIAAMKELQNSPHRLEELKETAYVWKRRKHHPWLKKLITGDLTWAIKTAKEFSKVREYARPSRPADIERLWKGNLAELAAFWKSDGIALSRPELKSTYNLALFGIESPGGFQSWNAATGHTERHNWLASQRLQVFVDTYGTFSPEPAASRLFVPDEHGDAVRGAVTMAFLRHAKSLALEHSSSKEWQEWFEDFLESWGPDAFSGVQCKEIHEFSEELRNDPRLPNFPMGGWVTFAASHSTFGRILLTRDLIGLRPFLDLDQPIGRKHIENAAREAGVPPDQIDATVLSLSRHLGWDITKGFGTPAPEA